MKIYTIIVSRMKKMFLKFLPQCDDETNIVTVPRFSNYVIQLWFQNGINPTHNTADQGMRLLFFKSPTTLTNTSHDKYMYYM